ncbi:MAG: hypothetical protein CMO55_16950 [Verrucomicrobiales bacterium]|nr:hypothetical protein [Verrucomicrobiales bacterium]
MEHKAREPIVFDTIKEEDTFALKKAAEYLREIFYPNETTETFWELADYLATDAYFFRFASDARLEDTEAITEKTKDLLKNLAPPLEAFIDSFAEKHPTDKIVHEDARWKALTDLGRKSVAALEADLPKGNYGTLEPY